MSKLSVSTQSLELPYAPYRFFNSQRTKAALPPAGTSLAGQTGILTGGNIGLGFGCAEWLVELQVSRLILAVRTPSKGEAAAEQLRKKSPGTKIEVWQIDMLSYKSIRDFADKCKALDRLDFAILNAGKTDDKFIMGKEGHEEIYQVNYLSTVLLSHLLLPLLKEKSPAGKPGRLTLVNSGTAHIAKLPRRATTPYLPTWDVKASFDGVEQYSGAKALSHLWIVKLVQRVRREDVVVNLVDPGFVKGTGLHRSLGNVLSAIFSLAKNLTGRTVRNGSSTFVDAAVVKGAETHGSYIQDWRVQPYMQFVYGPEGKALADKVWEETMAELAFADVEGLMNKMD